MQGHQQKTHKCALCPQYLRWCQAFGKWSMVPTSFEPFKQQTISSIMRQPLFGACTPLPHSLIKFLAWIKPLRLRTLRR